MSHHLGTNNVYTNVGGNFDPSSPVPVKALRQDLGLEQTLSQSGSIFARALTSTLALAATNNEYYHEVVPDPIPFAQSADGPVDRGGVAFSTFAVTDSFVFSGTVKEGGSEASAIFDSTTSKGMVVYISSDGHVDLARADVVGTSGGVAVAKQDVTAGGTGFYMTEGHISRDDWTVVIGASTLTPGTVYYLSATTAGAMTSTAPTGAGEIVLRIGRALTNTLLDIEIAQPILL